MKKFTKAIFGLSIAAGMIACGGAEQKAEAVTEEAPAEEVVEAKEVSINAAESKVMWEGTMLGLYSHSGTVDVTDGKLTLEGDRVVKGKFIVDLTTMNPTDENYQDEEGHRKENLVGHLSSGDFFMVDSFPTATFEITAHNIDEGTIQGNLTIRGKTNPETVENVQIDAASGSATGELVFDRTKYDVSFSHPAEEMVLSDEISLSIGLKM